MPRAVIVLLFVNQSIFGMHEGKMSGVRDGILMVGKIQIFIGIPNMHFSMPSILIRFLTLPPLYCPHHPTSSFFLIDQIILQKNIGCRRYLSVFFSGNQWVIGSHAKWEFVIGHRQSRRPTRTNDNQCFFAISFGLMSNLRL